jgi:MFS family permease
VESHARLRLFLSLHLPAVALGLGTGITQPVLPVLAKSFEVGIGLAAMVFIAQMVGGAAGTLPTGQAIDASAGARSCWRGR